RQRQFLWLLAQAENRKSRHSVLAQNKWKSLITHVHIEASTRGLTAKVTEVTTQAESGQRKHSRKKWKTRLPLACRIDGVQLVQQTQRSHHDPILRQRQARRSRRRSLHSAALGDSRTARPHGDKVRLRHGA